MSNVVKKEHLILLPDLDKYGIIAPTKNTAQYLSYKLKKDNCCCMEVGFEEVGTNYRMTFVNFHKAANIPAEAKGDPVEFYSKFSVLHTAGQWKNGGGKLYISVEYLGSYCFRDYQNLHPNYLREKLNISKPESEVLSKFLKDVDFN